MAAQGDERLHGLGRERGGHRAQPPRRPAPAATNSAQKKAGWTPIGDDAIRRVWRAAGAARDPSFATYLRLLLLTGLRRGELAGARWADIDLAARTLAIPSERRKSGEPHTVYLGPLSAELLQALPKQSDLLFPGRSGSEMSGWTRRLAPVREALGEALEPHGLRRGYRTLLGELGVPEDVSERAIGHARPTLLGLYDRGELRARRVEAQLRLEAHVAGLIADDA